MKMKKSLPRFLVHTKCKSKKFPKHECTGYKTTLLVTKVVVGKAVGTINIGDLWDAYEIGVSERIEHAAVISKQDITIASQQVTINELRSDYNKSVEREKNTAETVVFAAECLTEKTKLAEVQAVEITMLKEELDSMRTDFAKLGANQQRLIKEK